MDVETETAMIHSHLPASLNRDSRRERATQLYAAALFKLLTMDGPNPRSTSAPSVTVASTCVRPIVYAEVWSDGSKQQVALQLPSRGDHRYSAEQWARAGLEGGGGGLQWVEQHVRQWASSNRPVRWIKMLSVEDCEAYGELVSFDNVTRSASGTEIVSLHESEAEFMRALREVPGWQDIFSQWEKGLEGPTVGSAAKPADAWTCAGCTLVNPHDNRQCLACGTRRPFIPRAAWESLPGSQDNPSISAKAKSKKKASICTSSRQEFASDSTMEELLTLDELMKAREQAGGHAKLNQKSKEPNFQSKYRGVTFVKKTGKFQAAISINGKLKYLGCAHVTEEQAARAYDIAARMLGRPCNLPADHEKERQDSIDACIEKLSSKKRKSSQYLGVVRLKSGKFQAGISVGGKQLHLGASFTTEEEAARAYDTIASKLGRPTNLPVNASYQSSTKRRKSSQYLGVVRLKSGKFQAGISVGGKQLHLGASFTTEEEAARAYDAIASKLGRPCNMPDNSNGLHSSDSGAKPVLAKSSRYIGVVKQKSGKFQASISIDGRRQYLGSSFATEEEAARAYDSAAEGAGREAVNFPRASLHSGGDKCILTRGPASSTVPVPLPVPVPVRQTLLTPEVATAPVATIMPNSSQPNDTFSVRVVKNNANSSFASAIWLVHAPCVGSSARLMFANVALCCTHRLEMNAFEKKWHKWQNKSAKVRGSAKLPTLCVWRLTSESNNKACLLAATLAKLKAKGKTGLCRDICVGSQVYDAYLLPPNKQCNSVVARIASHYTTDASIAAAFEAGQSIGVHCWCVLLSTRAE